jgi:predicted enzyme related to lactoylglutathione lyase
MNDNHPTFGNGKICYIEIPATNVDAAADFYQKVFGWHVRKRGDGSVAFDDAVNEVSGTWVTGRKPATQQGVLVHIMVDNIESTIKAIENNGGKIVRPLGMDAPEITAWFSDLDENVFGLYQHHG